MCAPMYVYIYIYIYIYIGLMPRFEFDGPHGTGLTPDHLNVYKALPVTKLSRAA